MEPRKIIPTIPIRCHYCATDFLSTRRHAKYCTGNCRFNAFKVRMDRKRFAKKTADETQQAKAKSGALVVDQAAAAAAPAGKSIRGKATANPSSKRRKSPVSGGKRGVK